VTAPFVDAHFHLDSALTYGLPRVNKSGTLLEGIALWGELKPTLTADAIAERALAYCDWAVARGLLAIRSHVDTSDPSLRAVEALLAVKKKVAPYLDLQLVAFPAGRRTARARRSHESAARARSGCRSGRRHSAFSNPRWRKVPKASACCCEEAANRGLRVDMHCDETDDPMSRHVETLAAETLRLGLQGRVTGSHLTSMHSMDNYYVSKLLPLMAEAQLSAIANRSSTSRLQGRHDTYPKRRGMTRVPELLAAGIDVAFGHDCVMDPWYSFGSGDMLEVAHMGLHVAQMTSVDAMNQCFAAVTTTTRTHPGTRALRHRTRQLRDLVLLQATGPAEAIRLRATRLAVVRRGKIVARGPASDVTLELPGRPKTVDFRR